MSDDEREPDTGDDPRKQGTGGGGYPESGEQGTEKGPDDGGGSEQSSDPSGGQDEAPSGATGNPGAAGG